MYLLTAQDQTPITVLRHCRLPPKPAINFLFMAGSKKRNKAPICGAGLKFTVILSDAVGLENANLRFQVFNSNKIGRLGTFMLEDSRRYWGLDVYNICDPSHQLNSQNPVLTSQQVDSECVLGGGVDIANDDDLC